MKVLSLLQPWASACFTEHPSYPGRALKEFETRKWKPSAEMLANLQRDGLLIQASQGSKAFNIMMKLWPFETYLKNVDMPKGFIIGKVTVGHIVSTNDWDQYIKSLADYPGLHKQSHEKEFGDYSDDRWAWHFTSFEKFDKPIPYKGQLNLFDYKGEPLEFAHK